MANKTINLKMIIDRSPKPEAKELRQALWTTHEEVNKAVAEIEEILLLCRGRSYHKKGQDQTGKEIDIPVTLEEVQKKVLKFARNVQFQNGKSQSGSDDEICRALQKLYDALVPSVLIDEKGNPKDGTAQQAKPYCTPLMLKGSKGGKDAEKKIIEPLPQWVQHKINGDANWLQESVYWINSNEGQAVLANFDKKSSWIKLKNGWQDNFIKDQEKQRKKIKGGGIVNVLLGLEQYGLMPLIVPAIRIKTANKEKESVGAWNQLSFKKAIEHLLTWESWNHRCQKEHAKICVRITEKETIIGRFDNTLIAKIRTYEKLRQQELLKTSLAEEENEFRINPRMLRGFDRIKESWSKSDCLTQKDREDRLAQLQTQLRGKFGDPDFYLWLAREDNKALWQDEDHPLREVAQLNTLQRLLLKRKIQSTYTRPDAVYHPKWAQYEAPGGTNLKNYKLAQDNSFLSVNLPLLCRTPEGLHENSFTIRLAASEQLFNLQIHQEDNSQLTFVYADEPYKASLGGSDILFDRTFLENCKLNELQNGNWGQRNHALGVWFKLVLDVSAKAPEGWLDTKGRPKTPVEIHHFKSNLLNKKHKETIEAGLRVLTVDLGVRTFASCAVFELVAGKPEKGLCWLADKDKDLWAKHERSFTLAMPGDAVSLSAQIARHQAYEELAQLKQGRNFIRSLLRLSVVEDVEKRTKEFDLFCDGKDKFTGKEVTYTLSQEAIGALKSYLDKPMAVWQVQVKMLFDQYEKELSFAVSQWRNATRPKTKGRLYEIGKSYWGIEYLEKVRDLLKGWSTHARDYGKINRWDRQRQGTFANRLLNHINNKKEDRIKTGADLLIQAARGKVYNEKNKQWEDKFAPCRLILFEDLAMYRFRTDRSRHENSQLMRWSHREIVKEAKQQSAIYGIHIDDTIGAGFSSKFYARNGCPGLRAKKLTSADLAYIAANEHIKQRLADQGFGESMLKEGYFIPWEGGEFFVSFSQKGKLEILHADINAAQNLQRRFWTRYADIFRVPVKQMDEDGLQWLPQTYGDRLKGGISRLIGGDGTVEFIKEENGFMARRPQGRKIKQMDVGDRDKLDEFEEVLLAMGVEDDTEEGKGKSVFFRDASNLILPSNRFYDSKEFWGTVHRIIHQALREKYEPTPF